MVARVSFDEEASYSSSRSVPTTEAVMICLRHSRVPHLAVSIAAKRAANQAVVRNLNQQSLPSSLVQCNVSSATGFSTGLVHKPRFARDYTARRHASTKTTPYFPKLPPSSVRTQPNPRPTLGQRAAAQEALGELAAREHRKRIHMSSTTYFWICSLFGFVLSTYIMYTYISYSRSLKEYEGLDLPQNSDVSSRWMDLSRNFDDEVEMSEKVMFLRRKRERLCREARGHVLEVSAGTGRNMDLYRLDPLAVAEDKKVKSLVLNDLSEIMLYQAQRKFEVLQENVREERRFAGDVVFVVGDASDRRLIRRPEGGFDTIIQTMGICSETNPVAFLRRLGELCRQPGEMSTGVDQKIIEEEAQKYLENVKKRKDYGAAEPEQEGLEQEALAAECGGDLGGKILLLEHGRSYLEAINHYLDNGAKMHADHFGCWWNKDIEQVVKNSGLIVERKRRYNFGTTYEYVLRPRPKSKGRSKLVQEITSVREDGHGESMRGNQVKGSAGGRWFSRSP